ncbi:hypothetical protein [Stenotrophomonas sp. ATCM1_4]|uniref:hypothetical protein n=1 Tax=Stenotrophomonas sp. ATCM1_4 TaxID=2259330 RepID=UPI001043C4DF|nr:hypothetical protein [Stenotrophomonas sp. ATCM1_4]
MQYKGKILVVVALVVAVVFGFWLWWRPANSVVPRMVSAEAAGEADVESARAGDGPAPAGRTVWARRFATGQGAGDTDLLVSAIKDANDCLLYHVKRRELGYMVEDERWADLSSKTPETLRNMDASSAESLLVVQRLEGSCQDSDEAQLIALVNSAVFDAALKGNAEAESCFVLFGPAPGHGPGNPPSGESAEVLLERYVKYAPEFGARALERGDPRVGVKALLAYTLPPPRHYSAVDELPKADPILTWRAARLASLRALPMQREMIDEALSKFAKMDVISPSEIEKGDAWAKEAFEREFKGQSPINVESPTDCYATPELVP